MSNLSFRFIDVFRRLIAEAERRRRDAEEELRKREEERKSAAETYSNIKEEVEDKRTKRDKLAKQLKKLEGKKADVIEKHQAAREELEAEQREIQKQAKLFQMIIENFVPVDERERLFKRMQFDDQQNSWFLKELTKQSEEMVPRPLSASGGRRSVFSDANENPEIARFKGENIILLQLDFPSRTTRDYEGPMVSPMIQAAIETAMKDEENIELNAK